MTTEPTSRATAIRSAVAVAVVCFGYWTYQVYQLGYNARLLEAGTFPNYEIELRGLRREAREAIELRRLLEECRRNQSTTN